MDLQHVDIIDTKPPQAFLGRAHDMAGHITEIAFADFNLGVENRTDTERLQRAAEMGFGDSITVVGRVVKVGNAELERAADNCELLVRTAPYHQARIAAAAEGDLRNDEAALADSPVLHVTAPEALCGRTRVAGRHRRRLTSLLPMADDSGRPARQA